MFEEHREREAERRRQAATAHWQSQHDAYVELIDTARTFEGTSVDGLLLGPGESVYLQVTGTSLVEERRGRGTYTGHSQGISVPVARLGGRQIRYRIGATKGHYVQGDPVPTAVDTGTTFVTSSRVVFRGANRTRECPFAKLIGFDHDTTAGSTTFSVSGRSATTTIHYGPAAAATFAFRLDLALAHFRHTLDDLVTGLEADLAAIDAARPGPDADAPATPSTPPAPSEAVGPPPAPTDGPPAPPPVGSTPDGGMAPVVAAGWYTDPWGRAPLRWWDGTAWSWQTVDPGAADGGSA